ncbi:MAG TPA: hypothetical protein VGE51_02290 [Fontimonas sp.]
MGAVVGVLVGVGDGVALGAPVGVAPGVGVALPVGVAVAVGVGEPGSGVAVAVEVGVAVAVVVGVAVGAAVGVALAVGSGVGVGSPLLPSPLLQPASPVDSMTASAHDRSARPDPSAKFNIRFTREFSRGKLAGQ